MRWLLFVVLHLDNPCGSEFGVAKLVEVHKRLVENTSEHVKEGRSKENLGRDEIVVNEEGVCT